MDVVALLVLATALAATCGLRAFVPLVAVSVLAGVGLLELQTSWAPLGSVPLTLVLGGLAMAEVLLDKVPRVDRVMDVLGFALRPVAATLVVLAIAPVDPLTAAAVGGVAAAGLGIAKARIRDAIGEATGLPMSSVALSTFEDAFVLVATVIAWVAPILTLVGLATLFGAAMLGTLHWQRRRWAQLALSAG